ncbi:MAG: aminoacyl-tRNA hydrolase [Candidatus Woesebacteria bacterium]|nr:aminoacyl-tRNA hydrolase [Candidatus Woesebacteria bacterium]
MKLIIGLGNPGEKYINNRHNVGYIVVDAIKNKNLKIKDATVVKTNTFMNDSGSFVKRVLDSSYLVPSDLYIVHDDLDLPLGSWKMQFAKGPKDNGGINSIEQVLGTENFWRIRVGVDNRKREPHFTKVTRGETYVLEDFSQEERAILDKAVDDICSKLATF